VYSVPQVTREPPTVPTPSNPSWKPSLSGTLWVWVFEVVDEQLAVGARAGRHAPGRVDRHDHVVAQRLDGIGLVLGLEPLHQNIGNDPHHVERLPRTGVVARHLREAETRRGERLPLDAVRGELLTGRCAERRRERRGVELERAQPAVELEAGDRGRRLRQRERALLARSPVPAVAPELEAPRGRRVREVGLIRVRDEVAVLQDRIREGVRVLDVADQQVREREPALDAGAHAQAHAGAVGERDVC
jgi:hypothetical protein